MCSLPKSTQKPLPCIETHTAIYSPASAHLDTHTRIRHRALVTGRVPRGEFQIPLRTCSKLPIGHPAQLMRMSRLERLLHPTQFVVQHFECALLACVRLEH